MTAGGSAPATLLIVALLAASAGADAALRRIPNALPVSIGAVGLWQVVTTRGPVAALVNLLVAAALGALLVWAWRRRLLGGGDVKLAVACAAWLGPGSLVTFGAATAITGGALSIVTALAALARRSAGAADATPSIRERIGRATVPYGAAIAAGAVFASSR